MMHQSLATAIVIDEDEQAFVEKTLLTSPLVDDCRMIVRQTASGTQKRVAYVIPSNGTQAEDVYQHMQEVLPVTARPDVYVPITSLPLSEDGGVDEQALMHLPIFEDDLLPQWESDLQAHPDIDQVALLVDEDADSLPRVHLWDLLPSGNVQTADHAEPAIPLETDASAREDAEVAAAVPAFSDGGPLVIPDDAPKTLTEAIFNTVERFPDKGIYHLQEDGSATFQSYTEILEEAKRILTGLTKQGLKPGDRAILQVQDLPQYFPTFWACVLGGITPVTVAKASSYDAKNAVVMKMFHAWNLLEQPPILASAELVEPLRGLTNELPMDGLSVLAVDELRINEPTVEPYSVEPEHVAFFQLSSGTTGPSKGIRETHYAIVRHVHAVTQFNDYNSDNVTINWLPMDHVVPLLMYHIKDLYSGMTQIQIPTNMVLADPLIWLDVIEKYKVTHFWSPNFGYKMLNDRLSKVRNRTWDLSSVKYFFSGGEQVTWPVVQEFLRLVEPFGVPIAAMQPSYGMAEMATGVTFENNFTPEKSVHFLKKESLLGKIERVPSDELGTVNFVDNGPPMPGTQVRIVDNNNELLPEGVIGRIQVRGEVQTPGYLNNEKANRDAFVGDGWYNSGDLGFLLNGGLTITGREKELIIIHGANFYCTEIEDVVNTLDGVETTFVAACGFHNPDTGTDGLAIFFTPQQLGIGPNVELIKAIRTTVTQQIGISPAYIIPVPKDEFPKTTSGKLQRTKLKDWLMDGQFQDVLKEVDIHLENNNTLPNWFYQRIWRPKTPTLSSPSLSQGNYLLFLDSDGLGESLHEQLIGSDCRAITVQSGSRFTQLSDERYRIDPVNAEHYHQLLQTLSAQGIQIDHVVHMWTYGNQQLEVTNAQTLVEAQQLGANSLLLLVQALAANHDGGEQASDTPSVHLTVVSSHAQPVFVDQPIAIEKAPLLGIVGTIPHEMPWLVCRHVDLDFDLGNTTLQMASVNHLRQELDTASKDVEVAYRQGQRYIPRLESADWTQPNTASKIKEGGIYLVTGGLGGVGAEIAKGLLRQYNARLLLTGRSPLVSEDGLRNQLWEELSQLGDVRYAAVDVCDLAALEEAVSQAESAWGDQLAGVFHAAGVIHEHTLQEETPESFQSVLRPKMEGTWQLHQLLSARADTIFVSFSSVYGIFSSVAVSAYAAANRFLDHFVHYQNQQKSNTQSYCFAWSMWDSLGMSQEYTYIQDIIRARGSHILSANQGWLSFLAGLHSGHPHLLIGLDGHNQNIRSFVENKNILTAQKLTAYFTTQNGVALAQPSVKFHDHFQTEVQPDWVQIAEMPLLAGDQGDSNTPPAIDRTQLRLLRHRGNTEESSAWEAPRNDTERKIADIWQEILSVSQLSIHDNFLYLGGSSIQAMQAAFQLSTALQVELTVRELFESPTVAELAERIPTLPTVAPVEQTQKKRARGRI